MFNIFKKSNKVLSRKQFIIKGTLISLIYPVVPISVLILMSIYGGPAGAKPLFAIVSLCMTALFAHMCFSYVLSEKAYKEYVEEKMKSFQAPFIPSQTISMSDLKNINQNSTFIELDKAHYDGYKLIKEIAGAKRLISNVKNQIDEIERSEYGVNISFGSYVDNFVPKELALTILYNIKNWLIGDLAKLEKEFYQKFPNKDEQGT